uniref:NAD(P)(+) transhydrogenase (Si-specific) n=1 Tax=Fibrocapsa japonica TaxID=94617 RepID=A0A7S2Y1R6_9STRA
MKTHLLVPVILTLNLSLIYSWTTLPLSSRRPPSSISAGSKGSNLPDLSQASFPERYEPYDLLVIGCGPGGEAAAVNAAKLGASVALIEKKSSFGGPTGLTSKAVREATKRICKAIDQVGGDRRRQVRGLWRRRFPVLRSEAEVLQAAESRGKLRDAGVDVYIGAARLQYNDRNDFLPVQVCKPSGCTEIEALHTIIATGSRANIPAVLPGTNVRIPFLESGGRIVDATKASGMSELPNSILIIGGGVIAVEYATVFAELGVGVTLLCKEKAFLPFLDTELKQALLDTMRQNHVLVVHEDIEEIKLLKEKVSVEMFQTAPGKKKRKFLVDKVLYSGGRDANSEGIGCEDVGIDIAKYGRISVDDSCRTTAPKSIYAIGDVIGPPGLASSAMQQGREVTNLLFADNVSKLDLKQDSKQEDETFVDTDDFFVEFSQDLSEDQSLFGKSRNVRSSSDTPLTLWTIPEIASVGTGLDASQAPQRGAKVGDIVCGRGFFKDCARGRLSGEVNGFVKVAAKITSSNTHEIIGCCIFGEGANELIQMGSMLISSKATLETVSRTPFAAVTLSGLFQVACDDALAKSPLNAQVSRRDINTFLSQM